MEILMGKFYYVTCASKKSFITNYAQYAIKSLVKTGVDMEDIHVVGNSRKDCLLLRSLLPAVNIYELGEDLSKVVWTSFSGKRRFSLFKAAGLYKKFGQPIPDKYMVYFDGDVLWYKNPDPFFETKCEKTWFHHGKGLDKRATLRKREVDVSKVSSLSKWCSLPMAHLIVKYGGKVIPDREVVAGLYLMHPRDHEAVIKMTYDGCVENSNKFAEHEGAGDQKPMNAALSALNIDWHGGSKTFCPEHEAYFDHFFGKGDMKDVFKKRIKKLGLL